MQCGAGAPRSERLVLNAESPLSPWCTAPAREPITHWMTQFWFYCSLCLCVCVCCSLSVGIVLWCFLSPLVLCPSPDPPHVFVQTTVFFPPNAVGQFLASLPSSSSRSIVWMAFAIWWTAHTHTPIASLRLPRCLGLIMGRVQEPQSWFIQSAGLFAVLSVLGSSASCRFEDHVPWMKVKLAPPSLQRWEKAKLYEIILDIRLLAPLHHGQNVALLFWKLWMLLLVWSRYFKGFICCWRGSSLTSIVYKISIEWAAVPTDGCEEDCDETSSISVTMSRSRAERFRENKYRIATFLEQYCDCSVKVKFQILILWHLFQTWGLNAKWNVPGCQVSPSALLGLGLHCVNC